VLALVGARTAVEGLCDADLPIRWTPLPALSGIAAAIAPGAPLLHAHAEDNVLTRGNLRCGDVEAAHQAAAATVEGKFETGFVEHAYIEPEAGFAVPAGDRIEVTACTQAPYMDRDETARVLGVDPSRVRIRPSACGGGFGGKLDVSVQPLLAVAAKVTGRPVRMVYSRTESMSSTTKRHPARIWARASADAAGRLLGFEMDADFNTGAYASWGPTVANRVPVHASGPYQVANVWNRSRAIYTNDTPAGAFRGFGVPQAAIAHETLMDDLAEELGIDRWQIRRINAIGRGDATPSGQVLHHSAGLPECLDALKPDWDEALRRAAAFNDAASDRMRRGVGVACMWYGCGNTALPNPSTMRITLGRDGQAHVLQRRGRYWTGIDDRAPADRGGLAGRSPGAIRTGCRRYRPDGRRRQDLRIAADIRVRQCGPAGGAGSEAQNPGARQCRERGDAQPCGAGAPHRGRRGVAHGRSQVVGGRSRRDRAGRERHMGPADDTVECGRTGGSLRYLRLRGANGRG
jgi:CO/xanthine dehydrogenase Mo-binding subunit